MTKPLLPPQYVNVPAALAYGDLSRTVIVTGLRIYGLGWRYRYTHTDPIDIADLCAVCGVSRSKFYEQLAQLVPCGLLQYTNSAGRFTFTFQHQGASPVFGTDRTLGAAGYPSSESLDTQQQQYSHGFEGGCGGDGLHSRFRDWAQRLDALDRIGVREPARTEIADLEHVSAEYLDAWATWFGSQSKLGVGAVIAQLRAGVPAPEGQPSYIDGEYGQYIQH